MRNFDKKKETIQKSWVSLLQRIYLNFIATFFFGIVCTFLLEYEIQLYLVLSWLQIHNLKKENRIASRDKNHMVYFIMIKKCQRKILYTFIAYIFSNFKSKSIHSHTNTRIAAISIEAIEMLWKKKKRSKLIRFYFFISKFFE